MSNRILFFSKKAMELSISKLVGFIFLLIVVFIVVAQFSDITDTAEGGLSDFKLKSIIEKCEISSANCNVKICSDESENDCNEVETSTWISFENYHKKCSKEIEVSEENYKKLNCGVLFKKIDDVLNTQINNNENYNGPKSDVEIKKLLGDNINYIDSFAKIYNIEPNKLSAFLIVESSANAFDGDHPTVRFECLRFNKNVKDSKQVICNTDKYKYGNSENTDKNSFLKALDIDSEQAMLQSSYGLGQVMGFNYRLLGYSSVEKYYEDMFDEEKQVKVFLTFILKNSKILKELQKENTRWQIVAENYNGQDYAINNYDKLLEDTYISLS